MIEPSAVDSARSWYEVPSYQVYASGFTTSSVPSPSPAFVGSTYRFKPATFPVNDVGSAVIDTVSVSVSVPQKAPQGAIYRTESAMDLLERVKYFYQNWIKPGHRSGQNTHNISATVSIKEDEWETVGKWMWENRKFYNGLSVLNYNGGTYRQAPFEDCTKEQYEELVAKTRLITKIDEASFDGGDECASGACPVK